MPTTTADLDVGPLPPGSKIRRRGVASVYRRYSTKKLGRSQMRTKFAVTHFGTFRIIRKYQVKHVGTCGIGGGGAKLTGKRTVGVSKVRGIFLTSKFGLYGIPIRATVSHFGSTDVYRRYSTKVGGSTLIGSTGLQQTYEGTHWGIYRIAGANEGWVAYVGNGALPNLDGPPTVFSATLPLTVPLTPYLPVSGTKTVYITVRYMDKYKLVSQNQRTTPYVLTPTGLLRLPVPAPKAINIMFGEIGQFLVQASYPTALKDADPATNWGIWVSKNSDVDITKPPSLVTLVRGTLLNQTYYQLPSGVYFVAVALYRAIDRTWSPALFSSIEIPMPPFTPVAVPGGYDLPNDCSNQAGQGQANIEFVCFDDWQEGICIDNTGFQFLKYCNGDTLNNPTYIAIDTNSTVALSIGEPTILTSEGYTLLRMAN